MNGYFLQAIIARGTKRVVKAIDPNPTAPKASATTTTVGLVALLAAAVAVVSVV